MRLSDHLAAENVALDLKSSSKQDLLAKLADLASRKTGLEPGPILRALETRESLGSTGIGHGIAIPHATLSGLVERFLMIVRLTKPLDFEAVDDIPVDIVVLLLSPSGDRGQSLNILSCVTRSLRDGKILSGIRTAGTPERAHAIMTGSEPVPLAGRSATAP